MMVPMWWIHGQAFSAPSKNTRVVSRLSSTSGNSRAREFSVDYGDKYRFWTNANNSAILSLLAGDAQRDPPIAGNMPMPK